MNINYDEKIIYDKDILLKVDKKIRKLFIKYKVSKRVILAICITHIEEFYKEIPMPYELKCQDLQNITDFIKEKIKPNENEKFEEIIQGPPIKH